MTYVSELLKTMYRDERGMEMTEYAVLTALLVASLIAALGAIGAAIESRFNSVSNIL